MEKKVQDVCVRMWSESSVHIQIGISWQRGKGMVSRLISVVREFSIFHLLIFKFHFSVVWMQCTNCQECRKTYYCVVVKGMRWCFYFVSCHKWSNLDVKFLIKTIGSCSSGASMSGVDMFWGGEGFVFQLFHSYKNLSRSKWVRAEEGFWCPANVLVYIRNSFPSNKDVNLITSTLRLWISVLLWWSVTKWATRSRAFPHLAVWE